VRETGHEGPAARCELLAVPVRFRISLARVLYSHHLIVRLSRGDLAGVGEGVLYRVKPHQAGRVLHNLVLPWWRQAGDRARLPEDWTEDARLWASASPAVAYAVDTALWDLRGRLEKRSIAHLLGGSRRSQVQVTEQLFIEDWDAAEAELAAMLERGTRRVKLKIGCNPESDLEFVRRVREFAGPAVTLTVDANHAYSLSQSEELYKRLAHLGVAVFEEPLRLRSWPALRELRERVGVPVMLDESILSLEDLRTALLERALDLLNVKLTRVGGISLAQEYIDACEEHGVGVSIGCTEDLGIGTSAIVQLAATLGEATPVEALGPLRLGFDVVQPGWVVDDGALAVPQGPGLDVRLDDGWRDRLPKQVRVFDLLGRGPRLWAFSWYSRLRQRAENVWLRFRRWVG
jgi:L-alanine-DL-glutamate epimerase-like enolase superfamily enzyme